MDPGNPGFSVCGNPIQFPPTFTVDVSCSPSGVGLGGQGEFTLVPWPVGIAKIAAALPPPSGPGLPTNLDCTDDSQVAMPAEVAGMVAAVVGYNTFLAAETSARGYGYFDVNPSLQDAVDNGDIPPFPDLSAVPTGGSVGFGSLFSLDGLHPSTEAHRLIADSLSSTVNQMFGTTIPLLP